MTELGEMSNYWGVAAPKAADTEAAAPQPQGPRPQEAKAFAQKTQDEEDVAAMHRMLSYGSFIQKHQHGVQRLVSVKLRRAHA